MHSHVLVTDGWVDSCGDSTDSSSRQVVGHRQLFLKLVPESGVPQAVPQESPSHIDDPMSPLERIHGWAQNVQKHDLTGLLYIDNRSDHVFARFHQCIGN